MAVFYKDSDDNNDLKRTKSRRLFELLVAPKVHLLTHGPCPPLAAPVVLIILFSYLQVHLVYSLSDMLPLALSSFCCFLLVLITGLFYFPFYGSLVFKIKIMPGFYHVLCFCISSVISAFIIYHFHLAIWAFESVMKILREPWSWLEGYFKPETFEIQQMQTETLGFLLSVYRLQLLGSRAAIHSLLLECQGQEHKMLLTPA